MALRGLTQLDSVGSAGGAFDGLVQSRRNRMRGLGGGSTAGGALNFQLRPMLSQVVGGMGGGAESRLLEILQSMQSKPYLQGLAQNGTVQFGFPQLEGLIPLVQNANRGRFFQDILGARQAGGTTPAQAPPTFTFEQGLQNALGTLGRFTRRKGADEFLQELLGINYIDPAFGRLFGDQTAFGMEQVNQLLRQPGLVTNPLRRQFLNTLLGIQFPAKYMADVGITPYAQANLPAEILARLGYGPQAAPPTEEPAGEPPQEEPEVPPATPPTQEPDDIFAALISEMSGPIVYSGARGVAQRRRRQEILQQLLALGDPRLLSALDAFV